MNGSSRPTEVVGALCGIIGPSLSFGGFTLIGFAGFAVQPGASLDEVAQTVAQPAPPLAFVGLSMDILGSMAFAVFVGRLWGTLRQAEGCGGGWWATLEPDQHQWSLRIVRREEWIAGAMARSV